MVSWLVTLGILGGTFGASLLWRRVLVCVLFSAMMAFYVLAGVAMVYDAWRPVSPHTLDLWERRDIDVPGLRRPLPEDVKDEARLRYWTEIWLRQQERNHTTENP